MRRLILVASAPAYLAELRAQSAHPVATVRNVRTSVSAEPGRDPKYDMVSVRFEATLHNSTGRALRVATDPVILALVERRSEKGEWSKLLTSSSFDVGTTKYQPCSDVKPGADFVFPEIVTNVILESGDKAVHPIATVRFYFNTDCLDGSIHKYQVFVTEPVEIPH